MSKILFTTSLNSSNFDAKELMISVSIITLLTFLTLIFLCRPIKTQTVTKIVKTGSLHFKIYKRVKMLKVK